MQKTTNNIIEQKICSICGEEYVGYGNNAQPVSSGRCCDICNMLVVIPTRLRQIY